VVVVYRKEDANQIADVLGQSPACTFPSISLRRMIPDSAAARAERSPVKSAVGRGHFAKKYVRYVATQIAGL